MHVIAPWLPTGQFAPGTAGFGPAIRNAAGILLPFMGGSEDDLRTKLYMDSVPHMMSLAADPVCTAVRRTEMRTFFTPGTSEPSWAKVADGYRRSGSLEIYNTAAFDPTGYVRYIWEQLLAKYPDKLTYQLDLPTDAQNECIRKFVPPEGYDRMHLCMGLEGFSRTMRDEKDFPILGVLAHFPGDGKTNCWLDENPPADYVDSPTKANLLYVIRRPLYLGNGSEDPQGRIVVGGTYKERVGGITNSNRDQLVEHMLACVARQFGEQFNGQAILDVTAGKRPGHVDGFQIGCTPDGRCSWIRGQAGMGIVTAYGCALYINQLLAKH